MRIKKWHELQVLVAQLKKANNIIQKTLIYFNSLSSINIF